MVKDPITIHPNMTVREVLELIRRHKISGLPVVNGKKVVGIVTNRDLRFETKLRQAVKQNMAPKNRLGAVKEDSAREEVARLYQRWEELEAMREESGVG